MSDRVDLQEFVGGFVAEADELVATANASLLEIEAANAKGELRPRAVRELFRALHTIKGLAGMIGVEPIVEIAHALETLVRAADRGGGRMRAGAVEVTIAGVSAIAERVRAVAEQRTPQPAAEKLLAAIAATDAASDAPMAPPPIAADWDTRLAIGERQQMFSALRAGEHVWSLTFVPSEAKSARGVNIASVRTQLAATGDIIKVAPRTLGPGAGVGFDILVVTETSREQLATVLDADPASLTEVALPPEAPVAAEEPALEPTDVTPIGRAVVRVEMSRLDDLQEQLSQLIVSRLRIDRELARRASAGDDVRRLRELTDAQGRQLRSMRQAILRARMVRVAEVLEPLAMLVRSLARPGVKEVRLDLDVRDAEIDKAVADRLLPAIMHLVRNAVDHAIEPVDERLAAHKPAAGTVRVSCHEVGGNDLEIEVADDGRGVDRALVAQRAGRSTETDEALLDVLTTPGFSTRDVATQTSGRGLGMDIVKKIVVGQLGGELGIATTPGHGTMFRIRAPLTIAIVDVFSFTCGTQAFVVPVTSVEEIFEISREGGVEPPARSGTALTLVERRGRAMPVLSLDVVLAIGDGRTATKAIVVRKKGDAIAFAVDRMLGRQEVVVRPLEDPLIQAPGIVGATDLGDGNPTLVLDLHELGARVTRAENRS